MSLGRVFYVDAENRSEGFASRDHPREMHPGEGSQTQSVSHRTSAPTSTREPEAGLDDAEPARLGSQ